MSGNLSNDELVIKNDKVFIREDEVCVIRMGECDRDVGIAFYGSDGLFFIEDLCCECIVGLKRDGGNVLRLKERCCYQVCFCVCIDGRSIKIVS